ncbi:MAG: vWA domain-containing protein [Bacteroidota bacterium]|nr:vWA domain-containing protein [Kiloniellaceae bacterium]
MVEHQQTKTEHHRQDRDADIETRAQSGGAAAVTGQADAAIVVERPAPGETVEIQPEPGRTYVLDFPPDQAEVGIDGDDLYLVFGEGSGEAASQIVFVDLAEVADSAEAPVFVIAGEPIDSGLLFGQAAAAAAGEPPLEEVAAGPGTTGGGVSAYSDDLGSSIELLEGAGVIGETTLDFGTLDLGDDMPPSVFAIAGIGDDDAPERINLVLVLDGSGSMQRDVTVDGQTMTGLEAIDAMVEQMLDDLAGAGDEAVRVHMVSFAERVKEAQTFDIVVDGAVDAAALQAAKDFVLQDGDDPLQLAKGGTNYEAGFAAALDWFNDDAGTLDDPDVNQTLFVSDGLPTHAFKGDGAGEVVAADSPQNGANHVLGQAKGPGGADGFSEFDALLGSFKGTAGAVDAIGIGPDAEGAAILGQLDDDGAVESWGGSPAPVLTLADLGLADAGHDNGAGQATGNTSAGGDSRPFSGDEQIIQEMLDGAQIAA